MAENDPVFDVLGETLARMAPDYSPSGLQGVICGLLSTGARVSDAQLLELLAAHSGIADQWPAEAAGAFVQLRNQVKEGLADNAMSLTLLLPDDSEDIGMRAAALGQWCEGFLVGFATGSADIAESRFSPTLQEALSDLAAISQIATPDEDSDEDAKLFEEIAEHCRVSALMIYTELAMAGQGQKRADLPKPPTTH